ncbi:WhiB family transcriptional regulator [Streptomyces celluloflavus]|uniref:WhiB family transcriptional regulator n=1 Tax=Streptomyces celluloflavus TaxID=58344 RepID=UPI00368A2CC2
MHPAITPPPFVPPTDETPLPCTNYPELYFDPDHRESRTARHERVTAAQLLCASCDPERRTACATWARQHREWGVWGGKTEKQNGYRPSRRNARRDGCGTAGGARAHYRRDEKPCPVCLTADQHARDRRNHQKAAT